MIDTIGSWVISFSTDYVVTANAIIRQTCLVRYYGHIISWYNLLRPGKTSSIVGT